MGIGQELSVVNVSKYYGSFLALDNVSLQIGRASCRERV